jgi:hypothetical protein
LLRLPFAKGKRAHTPTKALCPICEKAKVLEPHTFIVLSGGSCLMDRENASGGPDDSMDGFLHLTWHGAHDDGEGRYRERGAGLVLADRVRGGQFALYVCSPKCLRKLFRDWVAELERSMKAAKPLRPPSRTRGVPSNESLQPASSATARRRGSRGRRPAPIR